MISKPNTGISALIQGSSTNSQIIRINNSYVGIDGSNSGGTGRNLTIENTNITTPQVIGISSLGTTPLVGAFVKNCNIINGINTSSALVIRGNDGTAGYFNDITIQNNSIQKAYIGVFSNAAVVTGNGSGLLLTENSLDSTGVKAIRYVGLYVQGADGAVVSKNKIANFDGTSGEDDRGIWFAVVSKIANR